MKLSRICMMLFLVAACTAGAAETLRPAWSPGRYGTIRDGILRIAVPPGPDQSAMNCSEAEIDLAPYRGKGVFTFSIRLRADGVSKPRRNWNGVKFMFRFRDKSGGEFYRNVSGLAGTFDWRESHFIASVPETAAEGALMLGLQDSSGTVEFDLNTLKIKPLFPKPESNYRIDYPERIAKTPPLRGVMSPTRSITEDDLAVLQKWGANLVRYQICRNWGKSGTEQDLAEYDSWLNGKLDHLEWLLTLAPKYGLRFVIDLHTPPGGRDAGKNLVMFSDKKYADHFVEVWRRIAGRFKGNPSVWAYDLVNEPVQNGPARYDYWNIQRMAAEAVRRIDPDTPIMIESNEWDSPSAFAYLPPLEMDNVIYQVHMYVPGQFTHQFVHNAFGEQGGKNFIRYPGRIGGEMWDKAMLKKSLQPVRDFQLRHNARIYVGEFSAVAWAPGAAGYIRDCIEIFEEYGWDWSYHAFREWDGWSVEHEGLPGKLVPSAGNDRKQVLLEAFRKNR